MDSAATGKSIGMGAHELIDVAGNSQQQPVCLTAAVGLVVLGKTRKLKQKQNAGGRAPPDLRDIFA